MHPGLSECISKSDHDYAGVSRGEKKDFRLVARVWCAVGQIQEGDLKDQTLKGKGLGFLILNMIRRENRT
jgi:hypothetical protein